MIANKVTMRTKYDCNLGHKIRMQSRLERRLNMLTISIPNRTIYDCNPFQKEPNMIAIIEILFSRDWSRNHSHVTRGRIPILQSYLVFFEKDCNHVWSDSELRLQLYLVRYFIKITLILRTRFDHHCNHIWSSLLNRLQSYLVLMVKNIAIISGPALYHLTHVASVIKFQLILT